MGRRPICILLLAIAACSRQPDSSTNLPPPPPSSSTSTAPPPPPIESAAEAFQRRQRETRAAAQRRLDAARQALAAERRAADDIAEALRRRLAEHPVQIVLRTGRTHREARIVESTFTDATFEADGALIRLPWDLVTPASLLAAAGLIYDPASAPQQFERGRFLMARRLWKDARTAFDAAERLDPTFRPKIYPVRQALEHVITGRGAHGGRAERRGLDELVVTYDFSSKDQLVDFEGDYAYIVGAPCSVRLHGGALSHGVEFNGSMSIRLKVQPSGPVSVSFFCGWGNGYSVVLRPEGAQLLQMDAQSEPKLLQRTAGVFLEPGRMHDLVLAVQSGRLEVHVDGVRSWKTDLPAGPRSGTFEVSARDETQVAPPLVVTGRVDRTALQNYMTHIEVLARRAADPDLRDIAERRGQEDPNLVLGAATGTTLTSDDPYLFGTLARDSRPYEELKAAILRMLQTEIGDIAEEEILWQLNALTKKHPDVASVWYLRGIYWWHHEDLAAAEGSLRTALALFPDFVEALALLAAVREKNTDSRAALEIAGRAIAARPDYAQAYVIRALAGFGCEPADLQKWLDDAVLALKLQPVNADAPALARALRYQARGPRDLGCRFEHETAHYRVVTDISEEAARAYGRRLETVYAYFTRLFPRPAGAAPPRKPRVTIFNAFESFLTYLELLSDRRDELIVGVFIKRWNELVLYESANIDETLATLHHEAFHHYVTLVSRFTPPYWFNEGLAEYMSGIVVKDDQIVQSGNVIRERLLDLRAGRPASFESVMRQTPREFYGSNRGFKYAQSWAMLHFLHHGQNGKYRPLVRQYFDAVAGGKTTSECYDTVFAPDAARLQKEWTEYVKNLR